MNTLQHIRNVSRRELLQGGAALTLAICLPAVARAARPAARAAAAAPETPVAPPLQANAFVRIQADGKVIVISKHLEMGQGAYTGLATLLADELDADWNQVDVVGAPADAGHYQNLLMKLQGTGGSTSMANSFMQYREAGAAARAMLVAAAAAQWQVAAGEISVTKGVLRHASGKQARFGELVAAAAQQPVPASVKLKEPAQYSYMGHSLGRVDASAKCDGSAVYTADLVLPDMLVACVARPPRFGARVRGFDAATAQAVPGVVAVVPFETPASRGVAVLAKDFWTAKKGRDALKVDWDESQAFKRSSSEIFAGYRKLAATPGKVVRNDGDTAAALKRAARVIEATYEVPFLAHASMEPLDCIAQVTAAGCEIWNGVQQQSVDLINIAQYLGIPQEKIRINMLYAGGSFGRRGNQYSDYQLEAVAIARAHAQGVPVKLLWTREDDMRAGYYRPAYVHAFRAGLDRGGSIMAWQHRIVGQSVMGDGLFSKVMVKDGIDATSIEGAVNLPYLMSNQRVELHTTPPEVPVLYWRSVGSSHTAYATECFFDEVLRAAGKDVVEMRRILLDENSRHMKVLNMVVQKSGWDTPPPAGQARGIAVHESFGSVVAQVVEVARAGDGIRIVRVVCAVDCGFAVNPNIVQAQMESGIIFGLSAACCGAITFKDGAVEQSNFHDYPILRMNEAPKIEVYITASSEKPSGVGEPGVPPVMPALCNAIAALTGKPVRTLPLSAQGIKIV
ncbi:MAG: xanthine dehydrogenase family protein molybdopterin-binding subunit [Gammaproteobacteria bacterium]|nr:xanthine dehydrogenase family protein molybdopterin-binding subunit [Gammaproteobacteria bacterium]